MPINVERLFYACEQSFLGAATTMVKDNKVDVNVFHCYTQLTPLMVAAQHGNQRLFCFLFHSFLFCKIHINV